MAVIRIHNVDLNTIIETKILWASRDYESQYNFPDDAVNGFLQVIEYEEQSNRYIGDMGQQTLHQIIFIPEVNLK